MLKFKCIFCIEMMTSHLKIINSCLMHGRKSGLVVSELDSRLEGRGFKSHPILDGYSVKAMPGSIPAPNPGSFN